MVAGPIGEDGATVPSTVEVGPGHGQGSCNNPTPQHGGNGCEGDAQENNDCNSHPCSSE